MPTRAASPSPEPPSAPPDQGNRVPPGAAAQPPWLEDDGAAADAKQYPLVQAKLLAHDAFAPHGLAQKKLMLSVETQLIDWQSVSTLHMVPSARAPAGVPPLPDAPDEEPEEPVGGVPMPASPPPSVVAPLAQPGAA
jgi:hypothetical protein